MAVAYLCMARGPRFEAGATYSNLLPSFMMNSRHILQNPKGGALRIYAHLSEPLLFGYGRGFSQMLFQHFLPSDEQTMH